MPKSRTNAIKNNSAESGDQLDFDKIDEDKIDCKRCGEIYLFEKFVRILIFNK